MTAVVPLSPDSADAAGAADAEAIVLVDEHDREVGYAPKLPPHQAGGVLHRAFSVFLFDSAGRMLLQRRALGKFHFPGLWTNACCSHPRRGQAVIDAARGRLRYELGIDVPLTPAFTFIYRADDPASGLTEHELDHVFIGRFDGAPAPHADEVMEWKWADVVDLERQVVADPASFTPWFKIVLGRVLAGYAPHAGGGGNRESADSR